MRAREAEEVVTLFRGHYNIPLIHADASELFLSRLEGIVDPEKKRKVIGATFIDAAEYEAHRITLGAPRGGLDFNYNDAFPHEADMDQLNGIDFEKGCYVGQEVVSRVEHRGTARKRVVPVAFEDFASEVGVAIKAGDIDVGVMGSSVRGR